MALLAHWQLLPIAIPLAIAVTLYGVTYVRTNGFPAVITAGGPGTLTGRTTVIDGDMIEIASQRVRFNGIDAPESSQQCDDAKGFRYQCGAKAANALDDFLAASRPVRCQFVEWDRYSRYVGNCFRADGVSVPGSSKMVMLFIGRGTAAALTPTSRPRRRVPAAASGRGRFNIRGIGVPSIAMIVGKPANRWASWAHALLRRAGLVSRAEPVLRSHRVARQIGI